MPRKMELCTCGHSYEHHNDDNECSICAEGYCPHGYDECNNKLIVRLIAPTEKEYADLIAALKKMAVVNESEIELT